MFRAENSIALAWPSFRGVKALCGQFVSSATASWPDCGTALGTHGAESEAEPSQNASVKLEVRITGSAATKVTVTIRIAAAQIEIKANKHAAGSDAGRVHALGHKQGQANVAPAMQIKFLRRAVQLRMQAGTRNKDKRSTCVF